MSEENKKENKKEKIVKEAEAEIVSIHDFKSMLIGMDLILGDAWTPTEQQWERIRKKIDALIETAERPAVNVREYPRRANVDVDPNVTVAEADLLRSFPTVPAAEAVPIGAAGPAGVSALAPPPQVPRPITPAAPTINPDGSVKTPDIDSSAGYKSSFV